MRNKDKYFNLAYEDFVERVIWNYGNDMLSSVELDEILNTMKHIKCQVDSGILPERRGVIELVLVFKENYLM